MSIPSRRSRQIPRRDPTSWIPRLPRIRLRRRSRRKSRATGQRHPTTTARPARPMRLMRSSSRRRKRRCQPRSLVRPAGNPCQARIRSSVWPVDTTLSRIRVLARRRRRRSRSTGGAIRHRRFRGGSVRRGRRGDHASIEPPALVDHHRGSGAGDDVRVDRRLVVALPE